jgi:thaumarchaeosortase
VFTIFFAVSVILAYGVRELKVFSLSFALLGGISASYIFDTVYPFGVFRPLQELALPTAATTAALFDILGYNVMLNFPIHTAESLLPSLTVTVGEKSASVAVSWACSGVHSLFLYVLVILVFFKKSNISAFRRLLYFFAGLFGTFFVNVLRVFSIIIVMIQYGKDAGMNFHNTYGELYSFIWIFLFIILISCIETFMLVERARTFFKKASSYIITARNKIALRLKPSKKSVHLE